MSDVLHGFIGAPPEWEITLHTAEKIHCRAHGYAEESDEYVFSLFFDGSPPVQFVVLRIPIRLVDTIYG